MTVSTSRSMAPAGSWEQVIYVPSNEAFHNAIAAEIDALFASDAARWLAVQTRDRRADGRFVFAVRTTGIYCRPSCPARMPKRSNVSFFGRAEDAKRLGFRACKRCQPDRDASDLVANQAVAAAAKLIEAAVAQERAAPPLQTLADRAGFSPFHFHRLFKSAMGLTPKGYEAAARSERLKRELAGCSSITDAIHGAGYSSSSRFYETAQARLGMTARERRAGAPGQVIRSAVAACSLGWVLVAATTRGICSITFGDNAAQLHEDLLSRFPKARLAANDPAFNTMVADVVALVERPGLGHALPLDIRGTAFQERVWRALQTIPPGQTASYAQIAAAIGAPRASRAVARACAANPAAVAIPCHRVIRGDGSPSGYRWGRKRKAELLARESEAV